MIMTAHKNSLPRSFLLAVTLAVGFATLWGMLVAWLGSTILEAWPDGNRVYPEYLVVTADGTPLIQMISYGNPMRVTFRDLNGRVYDDVILQRKGHAPGAYLSGEREPLDSLFASGWSSRIKVFMSDREPTAVWYFVHDGKRQGSGYFVGYQRVSNRLIGYIGLSGFRKDSVPPDERFPVRGELIMDYSLWSSAPLSIYSGSGWVARPDRADLPPRLVHVPCGNRLRVVDLDARTVTTVFEAPEPIVSVGIPSVMSFAGGDPARPRHVLVWAGQKIYAFDRQYHVVSTFTIPAEVLHKGAYWYEIGGDRTLAAFFLAPPAGETRGANVSQKRVYRFADDGTVRDSFDVALRNGSRTPNGAAERTLTALCLPVPAVLLAGEIFIRSQADPVPGYPKAVRTALERAWPWLLAVLALSSVLAALVWWRSRAFGLSRRAQTVWAVFVLLFGVPACVGFWLHRRWPVRVSCPHCHARSARDRDACAACGTPFPAPALKGIEIFA